MSKSAARGGLGRGFGALLGESLMAADEAGGGISTLPMTLIEPNPDQPRQVFDPEAMRALTQSIARHGVITPITVRKTGDYYQIIAGERRWRAARSAGLTEIPAMVIEADEAAVTQLALIENLQREDLNPIEEAEGYDRLIRVHGLTQEQVAESVGRSRPAVANALRLLALDETGRQMVAEGRLSPGHARAALAIRDETVRAQNLEKLAAMSVRQAERYAKSLNRPPREEAAAAPAAFAPDYMAEVEKKLEAALGRRVRIEQGKNAGTIALEYYGPDDLERLTAALGRLTV